MAMKLIPVYLLAQRAFTFVPFLDISLHLTKEMTKNMAFSHYLKTLKVQTGNLDQRFPMKYSANVQSTHFRLLKKRYKILNISKILKVPKLKFTQDLSWLHFLLGGKL